MKIILKWVLPGLLIILSFLDIAYHSAYEFVSTISADMLSSQLLLLEIKSLATPLIADIPFLKDSPEEIFYGYNKVIHYLTVSNGLTLLQIALLDVSRLLIVKIALVLLFAGTFIKSISTTCYRWLVIALFITPGLSLYINIIHYVSHASQVETGNSLKQELQQTQDKIDAQKKKQQSYLQQLEAQQKSKHHGRLTFGDKVEDEVIKLADDVKDEVQKLGAEFMDVVKFSTDKLIGMGVQMLVNVTLLFALMPLAYFFVLSTLFKRYFIYRKNQSNQESKQL